MLLVIFLEILNIGILYNGVLCDRIPPAVKDNKKTL